MVLTFQSYIIQKGQFNNVIYARCGEDVRRSIGRVQNVDVESDVYRVVADDLPDVLHDALPADLFRLFRVRDAEADLLVVYLVLERVQVVPDANVLKGCI